jgi:hypothetical protein
VAHADAEAKAPAAQLVQERRGLREVVRVAGVDVGDAGAELDRLGRQRERFAQRQAVAEARAVEPGKAALLDLLRQFDGRPPPAGISTNSAGASFIT